MLEDHGEKLSGPGAFQKAKWLTAFWSSSIDTGEAKLWDWESGRWLIWMLFKNDDEMQSIGL